MAHFRKIKLELRSQLEADTWRDSLPLIEVLGLRGVGALLALLPLGGELSWRAATALGRLVARLAEKDLEASRDVFRRLIWQMNEESGNIAWGVPEAMGEILAQSKPLALLYHKILISYIRHHEGDGNFCDHAPLRRTCYWALARLGRAWPELLQGAFEPLLLALDDNDALCRNMALYALAFCPLSNENKQSVHLKLVNFTPQAELLVWEDALITVSAEDLLKPFSVSCA